MVAYQGDVDFVYEGRGGTGKSFTKAFIGEGMSLMRVSSSSGYVFLADGADEVGIIHLEGESVTVNGRNVLAFASSLRWDIQKTEGPRWPPAACSTDLHGDRSPRGQRLRHTGLLQIDAPTFVDMQAAVLWSTSLTASIRMTAKAAALVGRGSGEAYQLALSGSGAVLVQASEGHPPATRRRPPTRKRKPA